MLFILSAKHLRFMQIVQSDGTLHQVPSSQASCEFAQPRSEVGILLAPWALTFPNLRRHLIHKTCGKCKYPVLYLQLRSFARSFQEQQLSGLARSDVVLLQLKADRAISIKQCPYIAFKCSLRIFELPTLTLIIPLQYSSVSNTLRSNCSLASK